jgi:YVTN family beta-propeller protein
MDRWSQPRIVQTLVCCTEAYASSLPLSPCSQKACEQKIIELGGAPTKMVLSPNRRSLFVVNPDLDEVDEIDTVQDALKRRISLLRPGYRYRGSNPNSLALSRDGATLYVTLGGENAVAVVDVHEGEVRGRIPTTWYPTSVTLSHDERRLYVVNFGCVPLIQDRGDPSGLISLKDCGFLQGYIHRVRSRAHVCTDNRSDHHRGH